MGKTKIVHAVDGVNLEIHNKRTLALVGESGCGKTTLGRLILALLKPTRGNVYFGGQNIFQLDPEELRKTRSQMQIIFQDPYASLNPRKKIHQILRRPYEIHENFTEDKINDEIFKILEIVGLSPPEQFIDRYPHELSGGQRQRIGISRAIALKPKFIVADEPVSSLDLSIRAQILNLMKNLQNKFGIAYLFITHDLAVVRSIAQNVAVMYLGKIVELAEVENLYVSPLHPYTKTLLLSTPNPNPRIARNIKRAIIRGETPSPIDPPPGCRFHTRCPYAENICSIEEPKLIDVGHNHKVACHLRF